MLTKISTFLFVLATPLMQASTITGFSQSIIVSGIGSPSAMVVTPDGRTLVTSVEGSVRVVQNGALVSAPALTLSGVQSNDDRGLMGITLDPNFATNGKVYLYYAVNDPGGTTFHNRLSVFTMSGNTIDAGSETILRDLPSLDTATSIFHIGGSMGFGADGKLYLGVGDEFLTWQGQNVSQDLGSYFGKILRLNPDGSIPSDNPFVGTPGALGDIFALGFRNPFKLEIQPGTGRILVNDVGEADFEEINLLVAGGNYGWLGSEGPDNNPSTVDPLYSYGHDVNNLPCYGAIVGGAYSSSLGSAFGGDSYYYADYCFGTVESINLAGLAVASPFASNMGRIVDLAPAPGGGLYYLSRSDGGVLGIFESAVPEPSTLVFMAAGLAMVVALRRIRFAAHR